MTDGKAGRIDALVAPHLERLYRFAYRLLGNSADAQDLVQDTCVAACENLDQLAANPEPHRWLLRVQHNRFIDVVRRRKRAPVVAMDVTARTAALPSGEPGPEELLHQAETEGALDRAFMQLDEMQRTLLILRAEGYRLAEIESITGIGTDVLRARLHRARRSLALRLDEQAATCEDAGSVGSGT